MISNQPSEPTYKAEFSLFSEDLRNYLKAERVGEEVIGRIIDSGYVLVPGSFAALTVPKAIFDGYYGGKLGYGLMPPDAFVEEIRKGSPHVFEGNPTYWVSSSEQILDILDRPRHREYKDLLSFRGQTKEYRIKRAFPHPIKKDVEGEEVLIIPSFWRGFLDDINNRPFSFPDPMITSNHANEIIYY